MSDKNYDHHLQRDWIAGVVFGAVVTLCLQASGLVVLWAVAKIWSLL